MYVTYLGIYASYCVPWGYRKPGPALSILTSPYLPSGAFGNGKSLNLTFRASLTYKQMLGILFHTPFTKPKQISRTALEMLCCADPVKKRTFNPCPTPLTLAIWDVGAFVQKTFGNGQPIAAMEMYKRDQILFEVLAFDPQAASKDLKGERANIRL
jgi:hypothetical protein